MGAMSGGFLGLLAETGILALDVSGIGFGNLPGVYPWTALHIYPLMGLMTIGGVLGGAAGVVTDAVTVAIGTLSCAGSSLMGILMGSLLSK